MVVFKNRFRLLRVWLSMFNESLNPTGCVVELSSTDFTLYKSNSSWVQLESTWFRAREDCSELVIFPCFTAIDLLDNDRLVVALL